MSAFFFFQAEDGIRYLVRSRGLGDVYKRQERDRALPGGASQRAGCDGRAPDGPALAPRAAGRLSLIHI